MRKPVPILILGDAPDFEGGLSKITRHIAGQLVRSPRFRVATLGRGSVGSNRLPWQQYSIRQEIPNNEWGMFDLERVWVDFAGRERGVVFTIWDPTRCIWLSRPEYCPSPQVGKWLREGHFDLWGYFPIDATGPQDRLSVMAVDALLGYRRLLAYTKWAKSLIERSLGPSEAKKRDLDWLPHGLELGKWPLREKEEAKKRFYPLVHERDGLVGALGTNQPRKDWGLVASVCQQLLAQDRHLKFWWHTDLRERAWSINALLHDFGLRDSTLVTFELTQEEMSWNYNACDLTLHPGLGEGFGYPIFESLASGVPALHGDYGGGADVLKQLDVSEGWLIPPMALRLEGISNQIRPVYAPEEWVITANHILGADLDRRALRDSVAFLDWKNLWPMFEKWFERRLG